MKKFRVYAHVEYQADCSILVEAENEAEAKIIASDMIESEEDIDWCDPTPGRIVIESVNSVNPNA